MKLFFDRHLGSSGKVVLLKEFGGPVSPLESNLADVWAFKHSTWPLNIFASRTSLGPPVVGDAI